MKAKRQRKEARILSDKDQGSLLWRTAKNYWFLIPVVLGTFFLFHYVFFLGYVPSESMEPTLDIGSGVFAIRTEPGELHHGDVVIFDAPDGSSEIWIKRVIGLPGDEIAIRSDGVYRNGQKLSEEYVNPDETPVYTEESYAVPAGKVFVMGDNRNRSNDSRFWDEPFLSEEEIDGKAVLKFPVKPGCKSGVGVL